MVIFTIMRHEERKQMGSIIGGRLAALLAERGMSQKQLAEATNLTPAAVIGMSAGTRATSDNDLRNGKALGVNPSDITGDEVTRETDEAIKLIARNAHTLTKEQKAELIAALVQD